MRFCSNISVKPLLALSVLALTGCQSYQPRPLDLDAHARSWRARSPASDQVRQFAVHLAGQSESADEPFNIADGLSLPEAELVALVYSADLRLARLRAGVAKATADHAGLWDDPQISIDVLRIVRSVPDPWVVGSAISFTIPISGRLDAEKQRAGAELHAALDRVAEAEWQVRQDVRDAWAQWSAERLRLEQSRQLLDSLGSVARMTQRLAELGELPRPEASLFTIEQASRRAELRRLEGDIAEAEQRLRTLMGLSPAAPLELIPSLASPPLPDDAQITEANLTLSRLAAEYAAAEARLLEEIRKQYPDLELGPQYESDEGQSRIGFVGAIPLPILNANKQGIAEARAERELAQAAYETQYELITGRLAAEHARFDAARANRQEIEATLVDLVDRQVADARRLMELGEGSSLVLLESLLRAQDIKLQLIDTRLRETMAGNQIRFLTGPNLPKVNP